MEMLINLSKEKGFESKIKYADAFHPNYEYYIFLCELQKWLREEHKLHVLSYPSFVHIDTYIMLIFHNGNVFAEGVSSKQTYEEALEQGLLCALNSIKL